MRGGGEDGEDDAPAQCGGAAVKDVSLPLNDGVVCDCKALDNGPSDLWGEGGEGKREEERKQREGQ